MIRSRVGGRIAGMTRGHHRSTSTSEGDRRRAGSRRRRSLRTLVALLAAALLTAPASAASALPPDTPAVAALPPDSRVAPVLPADAPVASVVGAAAPATRVQPAATDHSKGLRVEGSTTYTIDLDAPAVHVTHTATLTNTTPNKVSGGYVTEYYFTGYTVSVVEGATNLKARRVGGGSLSVSLHTEKGYLPYAVIQLSPRLYYRHSQTVELTYDLPPQAPRSETMTQVNAAFASFPVFTSADPGLGSATVVIPRDADQEIVGAPLDCTRGATTTVCTATDIADPETWYTMVVAREDDALVERTLEVGDKEIHIRAWPDDSAWLDFTSDTVQRGLPALEKVLGRDWGVRPRLDIVETSTPYLYGYAGWYELQDSLIEIGDDLDPMVTLHEISHAWFNEETFADRWVDEALADEYATLALDELGEDHDAPEPVDTSSAFAVPLVDWEVPPPTDPDAADREQWGYNASWWVAHALVEEIGTDAMSSVVLAAADSRTPYPAPTTDDRLPATPDWRTFLDLVDNLGGSTQADQLFRDYVVDDSGASLLDARAAARERYDELLAAGKGWAPPAALREAMTTWSFGPATALMPKVADLLERRDAIAAELDTVGDAVPTSLERQFESATDVDALAARMDAAETATGALVEATRARSDANVLTAAGLLVTPSVETDLDAARVAMDDGDWAAAHDAAVDASAGLARAGLIGTVGAVVLALLVLGGAGLVLLRRRRRAVAEPQPVDSIQPTAS
jgi:hypothetical protein